MYPEKYIGNFVPGDTSDLGDETVGLKMGVTSFLVLLLINVIVVLSYVAENEYADDFDVANEAMEGTSEWPTTTAWFSENFTFDWDDSGDYFSGSIIIYCLNTSESWECGLEPGYDRIEIPYRCTRTEQVGPLENPCDWAMQMFVSDSYWNGFHQDTGNELWNTYEQCEWEGEPEDENLWSCYWSSSSDSAEYDTWWYYCEHHQNQSVWYCTDEFGEEISSPDNQNGTEYSPPVVQTTVNYDPDDPTRIAFVETLEWNEPTDPSIVFLVLICIIDLVVIGFIVVPNIIRYNLGSKSSD